MRIEALRMMRLIVKFQAATDRQRVDRPHSQRFRHRLASVCDNIESVTAELGLSRDPLRDGIQTNYETGERQLYKHIHVRDRYEFELTVYPASKSSFPFQSSITGKKIEKANFKPIGGTAGSRISRA